MVRAAHTPEVPETNRENRTEAAPKTAVQLQQLRLKTDVEAGQPNQVDASPVLKAREAVMNLTDDQLRRLASVMNEGNPTIAASAPAFYKTPDAQLEAPLAA